MKTKVKNPDAVGFKAHAGVTLLDTCNSVASTLMQNMFMLFLTDYAGIGSWGAIIGTVLLFAARIFDAVNDPLEGYIIDKAKVGKHGKYRPFLLLSILLTAVGVSCLFFIPRAVTSSFPLVCIWIVVFYLVFDIGSSFYAPQLLYRTMTLDSVQRGKMLIGPRMANMAVGIVMSSLLSIVAAVSTITGSMSSAFGLTVVCFSVIGAVVSLIGLCLVKEKYHVEPEKDDAPVKISDIFTLLKENDALRVRMLSTMFGGFIWTLLFATLNYYTKWAYCTDLTTGQVDSSAYGMMVLISSMMMFSPLILGTLIATPLMKKMGPMNLKQICLLAQGIPCGLLFLFHVLGILPQSPVLFFALVFVVCVAMGTSFVPSGAMGMETMDYQIWKNGKDRSALCNACTKFLDKAQTALSSSVVGALLIAIGYEVDSATDTFLGELSQIPTMLTGFVVICGLIPCVLSIISFLINRKYPITNEIRAKMKEDLGK